MPRGMFFRSLEPRMAVTNLGNADTSNLNGWAHQAPSYALSLAMNEVLQSDQCQKTS
jgi:hypothetical protein